MSKSPHNIFTSNQSEMNDNSIEERKNGDIVLIEDNRDPINVIEKTIKTTLEEKEINKDDIKILDETKIVENQAKSNMSIVEVINNKESFGFLKINVINVRGENLPSKMRLIISLENYPDMKIITTKVDNTTETPLLHFRGKMDLSISNIVNKDISLLITLKEEEETEEAKVFAKKKIDLKSVFENDFKWEINNYIDLDPTDQGTFSAPPSVYIQLRWFVRNKFYPDFDLEPFDLNEVEKTLVNPILSDKLLNGILALNLVKAKNLQEINKKEKFGIYCQFWLSNKKNEKEFSQAVLKDPNPIWNEKHILNLGKLGILEKNIPTLIILVWDNLEFLGGLSLELADVIENADSWSNEWFKLHNKKNDNECGEIYLQLCYFKEEIEKELIQYPNIL